VGKRLTVVLDGKTGAGTGREVVFDLADYADIGHGYAATIHKNQGATVDQAHVLATPGMDRHLAYVALTRHRHAARLHWSEEDFRSAEHLRDRLGRERAKDTTLDYEATDSDPIIAFAELRGLAPIVVAPAPALKPTPVMVEAKSVPSPSIPTAQPPINPDVFLDTLRKALASSAPPEPSHPVFTSMGERIAAFAARQARQDARKQLPPIVPAVPYRPVTEQEVTELAGNPVKLRDHMQPHLADAYRDPAKAWDRLEALLQEQGSEEKVADILRQQGPKALGRLRGRIGIFSSERSWSERWGADIAARAIPNQLTQPRKMHELRRMNVRAKLEIERRREATEIPGLTPEALAAVERLRLAGAGDLTVMPIPDAIKLTQYEIEVIEKVGQLWAPIRVDKGLVAEFAAFQKAAEIRLGGLPNFKGAGINRAYNIERILNHAEQLATRYEAMKTARLAQEQAEAARHEAAKLAEEKRKQAAFRAKREPPQPRPRPSGPRMG
jgi:hypothetical protein